MGITIYPSKSGKIGQNADPVVTSSQALFNVTSKAWCTDSGDEWLETNKRRGSDTRPILRTSFTDTDEGSSKETIIPYPNGLVNGILRAYQQDLHLVLRPDDVWLGILTQFSYYVTGHAEELRDLFVQHQDKKTLTVDMTPATIHDISIDLFTRIMTKLVLVNVNDPELISWMLPQFSTTTEEDKTVNAIALLSTMKHYFEYVMLVGCGFPSVTLEGERGDWVAMRQMVGKFASGLFGPEPTEWAVLLDKVLEYMILTFDESDSPLVAEFWDKPAHSEGHDGSMDMETLSGWLTAFCFWNADGKRIYTRNDRQLVLDGIQFPAISPKSISSAVAEAPVIVHDVERRAEIKTTLAAGSVGVVGSWRGEDGETKVQSKEKINTFRPRSGWFMVLDGEEPL